MKKPRRRIPCLFLDFDGVLHPNLPREEELFSRITLLSALANVTFEIVISSSWRFQYPLHEITGRFPPTLAEKIRDVTGPALDGRFSRWREIQAYATQAGIENFVALDDSAWSFPPNCPHLIVVPGAVGLTAELVSTTGARLRSLGARAP
jgi:hypothetical protein